MIAPARIQRYHLLAMIVIIAAVMTIELLTTSLLGAIAGGLLVIAASLTFDYVQTSHHIYDWSRHWSRSGTFSCYRCRYSNPCHSVYCIRREKIMTFWDDVKVAVFGCEYFQDDAV